MNLYLDDDSADKRLVAMLTAAGHTVVVPSDVSLSGAADARHFIYANQNHLVVLTRNHDDFVDLHEVVQICMGTHSGVLVVRSEVQPAVFPRWTHEKVHVLTRRRLRIVDDTRYCLVERGFRRRGHIR